MATYAGAEDQAIEWVTRAISRDPHAPDWYYAHLGVAYHRRGDCPRAIEALEKVSWAFAGFSAVRIDCYVELKRLDDARVDLAKWLEALLGASVRPLSGLIPSKKQILVDGSP